MKRVPLIILCICCLLTLASQVYAMPSQEPVDETIPNTLLVRFQPDTSPQERQAIVAELDGTIVDEIAPLHIAVVRINPTRPGGPMANVAAALDQDPAIVYAEPNLLFQAAGKTLQGGDRRVLIPVVMGPRGWQPNDPGYTQQAYAWKQINAPAAWYVARGSATTRIAILDTGVDTNHVDLRAKLVPGYDFIDDDSTPFDRNGHGTHVAGLAAASTNNSVGIAGACPNCKLLPVRVLDDAGSGSLETVAQGIVYAADQGARIINLSLVGKQDSLVLNDALEYAWRKGALPVCAAGNDNSNNPAVYPAAHPRCLTVGATNRSDQRASYSNYGPWVTIAAPGDNLYSTFPGGYVYESGTSMATPIVAGTAGILVDRGLTNAQLRDQICRTADPVAGTGSLWKCGRLNMYNAVR